jgi:Ca-activated chloride channel homolog
MMRFLILLLLLNSYFSFGQMEFQTTKHDFGDLYAQDERFVDIVIINKSPKKQYLLTVKKPYEVVYLVKGQFVDPGDTILVRLQVNTNVKGKFTYEVNIFTSDKDDATSIKLTGNIKETKGGGNNAMTSCPDFNSRPNQNANAFDLTVVTIDKETKKPIATSSVTFIQNGRPLGVNKTNREGRIVKNSPLGFYYFYATKEGYFPSELGAYVNFNRNYIVLELERRPEEIVIINSSEPEPLPEVIASTEPKPVSEPEIEIEIEPEVVPAESIEEFEIALEEDVPTQTEEVADIPVELKDLDPTNFEEQYFKPINVVFVLDVSASMKAGEKMELMKFALFQLNEVLRPQDKVALVTYSTDAHVILPPTSGQEKEVINEKVTALKAAGYTAGGAGIKMGYKQALKGYINDGSNIVIVITDGAFNRNSGDYKKIVAKYKKKGILLSVVGIQNSEKDEVNMRESATLGGGRYIPIFKLIDAQQNLLKEIRFLTFRK